MRGVEVGYSRGAAVLTADRVERVRRDVARLSARASGAGELLEGVADRVRPLLDQDAGAWLATDPATVLFTDGYIEGFDHDACAPWYHQELSVPNVATFSELARGRELAVGLTRATGGKVERSTRWRELLEPSGFGRELRVVFRDARATWGVASIHRLTERDDFTVEDESLLATLSPVVAAGLRRIVIEERLAEAAEPDGPGILLVGPDGVPRPATESGERWLAVLGIPRGATRHPALFTVAELAGRRSTRHRRVRLQADDGRWVTMHTEALHDRQDTFAVVIQACRPADIAPIAALAYGLSPREQELLLSMARGEATTTVAAHLGISPYTVRDHLKSIFEKTGVTSRTELVARLFHDHYAEQMFSSTRVRHD